MAVLFRGARNPPTAEFPEEKTGKSYDFASPQMQQSVSNHKTLMLAANLPLHRSIISGATENSYSASKILRPAACQVTRHSYMNGALPVIS
jgi:hypothetical protein